MFCTQLEATIAAAPRHQLAHVSSLLWRAYAAGSVTEAEAGRLSEALELRKVVPQPAGATGRPRTGSRPRTPESMERRRRWASAGRLPPRLAAHFTLGEQAVLAVVAMEVSRHGSCRLAVGHIAALAGVSPSTVRNAMREAHGLSLVRIEERRLTGWRNDTNVVTIVSAEWAAWLRLRPKGGGCKSLEGTSSKANKPGIRQNEGAKSTPRQRGPMHTGQGADRNTGRRR